MKGKWKDRIWNGLMLATVAAALIFTLTKGTPEQESAALPLAVASVTTPLPTAAPAPAEAYRQERAQTRQRDRDALLVLVQSENVSPETRAPFRESYKRFRVFIFVYSVILLLRKMASNFCIEPCSFPL